MCDAILILESSGGGGIKMRVAATALGNQAHPPPRTSRRLVIVLWPGGRVAAARPRQARRNEHKMVTAHAGLEE